MSTQAEGLLIPSYLSYIPRVISINLSYDK